jgi:NAD(P)-dependent dehydrogenase (short-subunit alcohol dehydrogenase family)
MLAPSQEQAQMSNVLITGTSSGFGFLTVKSLLGAGHSVFAGIRDRGGRGAKAAAALSDVAATSSGTLSILDLDVTEAESVERAVAKAIAAAGHLDVVVNNAGLGTVGQIEGFTPEQFQRVFDVNVFGVQRVLQAALPHMRARKAGLVINIGSGLGRYVLPFLAPYAMTKYALECMTDSYAMELAPFGIEFSLIQPGGFPTNFMAAGMQPGDTARIQSYGEFADAPQKAFAGFGEFMSGPNAPNPQLVADKVVEIIALPSGSRPARAPIDLMLGQALQAINDTCSAVQQQIAASWGK